MLIVYITRHKRDHTLALSPEWNSCKAVGIYLHFVSFFNFMTMIYWWSVFPIFAFLHNHHFAKFPWTDAIHTGRISIIASDFPLCRDIKKRYKEKQLQREKNDERFSLYFVPAKSSTYDHSKQKIYETVRDCYHINPNMSNILWNFSPFHASFYVRHTHKNRIEYNFPTRVVSFAVVHLPAIHADFLLLKTKCTRGTQRVPRVFMDVYFVWVTNQ